VEALKNTRTLLIF